MAHRASVRMISVLSIFMLLVASCASPPAGQRWVGSEEQVKEGVDNCNAMVAATAMILTPFILFPFTWGKYCMKKNGFRLEPEVASG
jgi:hypothetical protein